MFRLFLGVFVCFIHGQHVPQNFSLYTDKKAKMMEDIVTVLIVEEAEAKNDTRTETDVESKVDYSMGGSGKISKYVPGLSVGEKVF